MAKSGKKTGIKAIGLDGTKLVVGSIEGFDTALDVEQSPNIDMQIGKIDAGNCASPEHALKVSQSANALLQGTSVFGYQSLVSLRSSPGFLGKNLIIKS